MFKDAGAHFGPEAIAVLDAALNEAWASLAPHEQTQTSRMALARRIVSAAARGVRDPARLRTFAMDGGEAASAVKGPSLRVLEDNP